MENGSISRDNSQTAKNDDEIPGYNEEQIGNLESRSKMTAPMFNQLSVCTGCLQKFPPPMHYPKNHSVIPVQTADLLECDLKRKSPSVPEDQNSQTSQTKSDISFVNKILQQKASPLGLLQAFRCPNMVDKIPMFPKAKSIFIHTGNIINWNRLKRKPNQTSTEEACDCFGKTLAAYLETEDKTALQYVTEIYKVNSENVQKLDENERLEVKITVKVFICKCQPASNINEVVNKVLNELGITFIETLLLAVCSLSEDDNESSEVSFSAIQPYWKAMEELVSSDKVLSLGICDLNKDALEDLYNWAKVKPSINQVNLQSCCVMPQDLTEYAKSVNVQLLTHNDTPVFISEEALQQTIQSVCTESDSHGWAPQWVMRYSGILKCRGIIKMKGYIFHASRS